MKTAGLKAWVPRGAKKFFIEPAKLSLYVFDDCGHVVASVTEISLIR